jgi:riboflavin transporter FmnP
MTASMCPRCGTALGSPHSKGAAVLLAVFLSFWTWVYTYKRDAAKFWVGLVLAVVGALLSVVIIGFFVILGVWVWAIIDTAVKSEVWYQQYPNG